jgi:predicted MPP superfamily phosphohydrolase
MWYEYILLVIALIAAWFGHAYIWTALLNYVYARPYPKPILKLWRHLTAIVILVFPALLWSIIPSWAPTTIGSNEGFSGLWGNFAAVYSAICLIIGAGLLPAVTAYRLYCQPPAVLLSETTHTLDLWQELGPAAIGAGHGRLAARLPYNCIYRVDFTEITLALPNLPPEWDGLTILHLSDVHYHGTPSRDFHERVIGELETRWPNIDLVCLTGDFVDTGEHHTWIEPLLGRLRGNEGHYAILGNHDSLHDPDRVRTSLQATGYAVLGNGWKEATIRGVRCLFIGHEGPWFDPVPDLKQAPEGFRICLSHTPDNVYWGNAHGVGLMLSGHVHGGQIRLPIITSIFVPSVYGRRFDMGVFDVKGTTLVVSRGLSGKEPLRFRCHPQVTRITLTPHRRQ